VGRLGHRYVTLCLLAHAFCSSSRASPPVTKKLPVKKGFRVRSDPAEGAGGKESILLAMAEPDAEKRTFGLRWSVCTDGRTKPWPNAAKRRAERPNAPSAERDRPEATPPPEEEDRR
jgi:hypothetical protein